MIRFDPTLAEYDREKLTRVTELTQERLKTLGEFKELISYFFEETEVSLDDVVQKGKDEKETKEVLQKVHDVLEAIAPDDWNDESVDKALHDLKEELDDWSPKQLFMTIRWATTGRKATPSLFETVATIGRDTVLSRLDELIS